MAIYYVNRQAQSNGDHEVHRSDCSRLPNPENKQYLGEYSNCHDAVRAAKNYYSDVDGCYYCCPACHTS